MNQQKKFRETSITNRVQLDSKEAKLRLGSESNCQPEEQFRVLAEESPNMIFINYQGKVVYANKKCETVMGYRREEFYDPEFDFTRLIAPEDLPLVHSRFLRHIKGEELGPCEYTLLTKSGERIDAYLTTTLIDYCKGKAILGIVTDITTRKQAERALKESEQRYLKILELAFEGHAIHQDGKIVTINRAGAELLGAKTPEEMIGRSTDEFIHPDYRDLIRHRIQRGVTEAELIEEKMIGLDGRVIDLEVAGILIDYLGKPARYVVFRDITARKRAEELLRQSKELYKTLVETMPDAVMVTDLNGRILNISNRALELMGYEDPNELIGINGFDLLVPEERKRAHKKLLTTKIQGELRDVEYTLMRKDGSRFIGAVNATILRDVDHQVSGFILTVRDVTAKKQVERALQQSEENFRTLAENSNDGILIVTKEGTLLYANKRISRICGYTVAEILELNMKNLFEPGEYKGISRRIQRRAERKTIPNQFETRIITRNRTVVPVELTVAGTLWMNQPVSVVNVRDIAYRKKSEAELLAYQSQLQSLASKLSLTEERERRKVAREIHDRLGQSLALSKIKLSELQNEVDSPRIARSLQNIREIIEELIQETRSLTFELCPPVLYELGFEPAVEWLAEQFHNRHHIDIRIQDDGKNKPLDDDVRFVLFDCVRELLMNVIKHARAKSVQISLKKENGFYKVQVVDDGIGFDTAQVHARRRKGKGFGHFQIRERLKSLEGQFSIHSRPGKGTCVSLKAPLR